MCHTPKDASLACLLLRRRPVAVLPCHPALPVDPRCAGLAMQAVSLVQQVSLTAAAELAAAATSAHPCSQRLWQQRLLVAQQQGGASSGGSERAAGAAEEEAVRREAAAHGVRIP